MTKKIDIGSAPRNEGSGYPEPFDEACRARVRHALGDAAGLTQFGVNLQRLSPGAWSSQRHWHSADALFLEVGSRRPETDIVEYPGIDLRWSEATGYAHTDGRHFEKPAD